MMKLLRRMGLFIDKGLALCEKAVMRITLIAILILILLEVILRYVFSQSVRGYEELAIMCVFWLGFIGAAHATRTKMHIKADILQYIIRSKVLLEKFAIASNFISFAFCAIWLYWIYVLVVRAAPSKSPALGIPILVPQLAFVLCDILMAMYFLLHFIQGIQNISRLKDR